MNKQIRKVGLRAVRRNPRRAIRLLLFAARHRKGLALMIKASRRASRLTGKVQQTAANPKVHAEVKLAVSDLVQAAQRARKVGVTNVLDDKRVAHQLRQASRHASSAVAATRHTRPRHLMARAMAMTVGAGVLGGLAYAGWRTHAKPDS